MTSYHSLAEGNMKRYRYRLSESFKKIKPSDKQGFTLIELAFVLVIVGLLVGMGVELVPMLVKQNKLKETQAIVKETKTAIIGYALATGRLPYASANTNGSETSGRLSGYLPFATIGISANDAYLSTLYYALDPYLASTTSTEEFKTHLSELISATQSPDLFCDGGNLLAAFVVISPGPNLEADSPNDDNGNGLVDINDNNSFEKPGAPQTGSYDDILEAASLAYLYGRFE
jgi:prepilin-type N-terminal cleavage/methylation domain-containing protein